MAGISFFGGVGEILGGVGKLTGKAMKPVGTLVGKTGLDSLSALGDAALGGSKYLGKSLINQGKKNPGLLIGSALTLGTTGAILADQDGQADPGRTAMKGATLGLGVAAFGGAGAVTGLGVAGAGAVVMGAEAFGQVGKMMMSPKTHAEKAVEIEKSMRAADSNVTKKAISEALEKQGIKAGSKEAVDIGLGNLNDFKLNKRYAVPLIMGASVVKGMGDGVKAFEKSRIGMNDGMMRSATPMLPNPLQAAPSNPSYANNAGATGDLVFAMHKNR